MKVSVPAKDTRISPQPHNPDHCVAVRDEKRQPTPKSSIDVLGYPGPAGGAPVARLNQGSHKREQRTCWKGPARGSPRIAAYKAVGEPADHTGSKRHLSSRSPAHCKEPIRHLTQDENNLTLPIDNTAAIATSERSARPGSTACRRLPEARELKAATAIKPRATTLKNHKSPTQTQ
jgi:hypothetical protein